MLTTDEKKNFEKIKARFTERYGNATGGYMAARNQFEIQNEIMSLQQKQNKGICEYVRTTEKLVKRVPQQLDSVSALCLIKGMSDENKKADISYIVHSQPKITFREVVEVMKAKQWGIGKADPFATTYIGGGRYKCKSDYQGASGNSGQVPYMTPSHGMNGLQAMIPVNMAAATRTVPSYHITRNPTSAANASPQKANVTTGGQLTTEHGIGGITEEQLFTIMDQYLQARGGIVTQGANTQHVRGALQRMF